MATAAKLITVAEFLERPEVSGGYEELRQGEVFMVAWPKQRHSSLQHRIRDLLVGCIGDGYAALMELAFVPSAGPDMRRADVGVISRARLQRAEVDGYVSGAPEIVIEVESPSNTAREFREKEDLCLANGSISFWVVYPDLREVTVAYAEGSRTYREGDVIELRGIAEWRVAVADLLGPAAR